MDGGGHCRRPKDEWGSIAAPLWCPGIGPHFVCRTTPFCSSCRTVLFDAPCRFVHRAAAFCLWRHTVPVIVQPRFVGAMPFRSSWRPLVLWRHSVSFAAHPDMAVRSGHGSAIRTWQCDPNMAKRFEHGKAIRTWQMRFGHGSAAPAGAGGADDTSLHGIARAGAGVPQAFCRGSQGHGNT